MNYEIYTGAEYDDLIKIYAKERSSLIDEIEELIKSYESDLIGYDGNAIYKLTPSSVICFKIEDSKVMAVTDDKSLRLKERLYNVEDKLGDGFVKINQSCIANIKKIERFEASIGGAVMVVFSNGDRDYISRRQLRAVKERIGFKL